MAHEACFFGDESELVGRCVPFISEGLSSGQPTAVCCTRDVCDTLRDALGPDAGRLSLVTAAEDLWRGGHETFLAWNALTREMGSRGGPWRLVAEPFWVGLPDGREWHRFEATINHLYAETACYKLCIHDRNRLPDQVLEEVKRTHPLLSDGSAPVPSRDYLDPAEFINRIQPAWTPAPALAASDVPDNPRVARDFAADQLRRTGLAGREDDVMVVVDELVTNSFEAGGRPVITTWTAESQFVIEVADEAGGGVTPLAGYIPPGTIHDSGRGLWLAWALSDDAALRSGPEGTAIRMYFGLAAPRW